MQYYLFRSVLTLVIWAGCAFGVMASNQGAINPISAALVTNAVRSNQSKSSPSSAAPSPTNVSAQNASLSGISYGGRPVRSSSELGLILSNINTEQGTALNGPSQGQNIPPAIQNANFMSGNTISGAVVAKSQLERALSAPPPQTKQPPKDKGSEKNKESSNNLEIVPTKKVVQEGKYLAQPTSRLEQLRNGVQL